MHKKSQNANHMFQNKPKNKKQFLFVLLVFLILFVLNKSDLFSSDSHTSKTVSSVDSSTDETVFDASDKAYFLPTSTTHQIIAHSTYFVSYNEAHEQAEWVAYVLRPEDLTGEKRKRPYFKQDPKVETQSAHWGNYKNSGYTKGHLLPAGDRVFSKEAYDETFYTSNISPQSQELNTGIWNSLESKIRNFVRKNGKVYVVTGGVLSEGLEKIGSEKVSVPDYFYKVLLYESRDGYKMVSFLIPHKEEKRRKLYEYTVPTDSIEHMTGLDFYHFLEDSLEDKLEQKIDYSWFR